MLTTEAMMERPVSEEEWEKSKQMWQAKIHELNKNINIFRKKIVEQKRNLGGVNAGQESQHALNK